MRQDNAIGLALLLAVATFIGNVSATFINKWASDADTKLETNVQLIELAIGILSEPLPDPIPLKAASGGTAMNKERDKALRTWAVDTINASAEIKFDGDARDHLIDGTAQLPPANIVDILRIYQLAAESRAMMTDGEAKARMLELSKEFKDMPQEEVDRRANELINLPPQ